MSQDGTGRRLLVAGVVNSFCEVGHIYEIFMTFLATLSVLQPVISLEIGTPLINLGAV